MGILHVKINDMIKKEAELILNQQGMTHSDAVRLLYYKIIENNGLPFSVTLSKSDIEETSFEKDMELVDGIIENNKNILKKLAE